MIIRRQQLFTENTLTVIIPLLARRDLATLVQVLRLWAAVLAANLVGVHAIAWVLGNAAVFKPEVRHAFDAIARESAAISFSEALLRGIFAGWLIAFVVWLLAAADSRTVAIIAIPPYIVGLAGLTHVIVGSVEVLFLVMTGALPWIRRIQQGGSWCRVGYLRDRCHAALASQCERRESGSRGVRESRRRRPPLGAYCKR